MGGNNSAAKVTNIQQDQSMELNPMVNGQDVEKGKSDQGQKKETSQTLKKIITIIVTIALLVEPIYSSYIAYQAYDSFNSMSDQIKLEVTDRFGYRMIQDLSITSSCNGEYETMFIYIFQGTNIRCDCRGKLNDNITPHFCSNEQNDAGCTQYNLLKEQVLSVFPIGPLDNLKSQLCVKQYMGPTFKQITDWPQTTCPTGKKMCGGKSKESFICVANDEKCPINSMIISTSNPDVSIYDEQLQFNSTHTLFYSRKSDNLPINYNTVTSGEGPCYNITQQNTYKGREDPFNFKVQRQVCDPDPRFQRLAEVGEYTFYKSSGIDPEKYFEQVWSFYKISDEYRYGFYVSHYPDWKYEKRNLLSTVIEFVEKRETIMTYQSALLYLNIANLVINAGFALLLIYLFCKKESDEVKDAYAKKKDIYNNLIKIAQVSACIYQIIEIKQYLDAFKESSEQKVSDNRTNTILDSVSTYIEVKVFEADKKMIISNIAGLVIALLGLLYGIYAKRKKDREMLNQSTNQ